MGTASKIQARLGVEVRRRGNRFQIIGLPSAIKRAEAVLQDLYARAQREPVDSERVHIALQELDMERGQTAGSASESNDELKVRTSRGAVRARGANQTEYLHNIRNHDLTFGIGPAGTGKTYLAVACAVEAAVGNGATDYSGAPRGRGRRAPRLPTRRPVAESGSVFAAHVRRAVRDAGLRAGRELIERNVIEVAPVILPPQSGASWAASEKLPTALDARAKSAYVTLDSSKRPLTRANDCQTQFLLDRR